MVDSRAAPITYGSPASPDEVGATVALVKSDGFPFCTGTLVVPDVVVTAAHCLLTEGTGGEEFGPPASPRNIFVIAGATDAADVPRRDFHAVTSLVINADFPAGEPWGDPLYDEMDIGALVLAAPVADVTPTPVLDPAAIDEVLVAGRTLVIAGFGTTDPAGMDPNTRLNIASVPYVRRSEYEVLAGRSGSPDTCYGDSGGPLYADTADGRRLVGATSRGADPFSEECGSGTVFTLVPAHLDYHEARRDGDQWPLPQAHLGAKTPQGGPHLVAHARIDDRDVGRRPADLGQGGQRMLLARHDVHAGVAQDPSEATSCLLQGRSPVSSRAARKSRAQVTAVVLATTAASRRCRSRRSSSGMRSARSRSSAMPSMCQGLVRTASASSTAAPAKRERTSTPGFAGSCAATYSLATRFMPSRSGVT
jgi:V8-like Glu-specific endopeptidase